MKGTAVDNTIKHLFGEHHMNYIECINVDYKSIGRNHSMIYNLMLKAAEVSMLQLISMLNLNNLW